MSASLSHEVVIACCLHRAALLSQAMIKMNVETEGAHAGVRAAMASAQKLMNDLSALLAQGGDHVEEEKN